MFGNRQPVDVGTISERLPGLLVSGLVVGAGARAYRIGYVIVAILIFSTGALIGWLFAG